MMTNLALLLAWDDVMMKQLPSLASVSLQARRIAGQYYRYFGFHFLVVVLLRVIDNWVGPPMPLGFAHDTTALVYQRACQCSVLGH
jgi:hypothetical protein